MQIGQVFRYSRPYAPNPEKIDGLPNYFYYTYSPGHNLPLLDAGINPIQKVSLKSYSRRPAILISSSPHKIGSEETPWQDFFDPDHGHIRYFGDNKSPGTDPASPNGNRALLEQFELHSSPDIKKRMNACPIVFFKRVVQKGRIKGNVQFQGIGLIHKCERLTQFDRKYNRSFTNYVFDFVVLNLTKENEEFDWSWISARRDRKLTDDKTLELAPKAWQNWVKKGAGVIESSRRRVVKLLTYTSKEQQPVKGSREEKILVEIYNFYRNKKSRFEALAALIAAKVIGGNSQSYRQGWITPSSSDGGADFIGRFDVGSGFSRAKLVILGQAKCEKLNVPTSGNHIARTVARLRRGWLGVYVTTSYFSEAVQREVLEDGYPIVLINGMKLAKEVIKVIHEEGHPGIKSFLLAVDAEYERQIVQRNPEEILFE